MPSSEEIERFVLGLVNDRQRPAGEGTRIALGLKDFGGTLFDVMVKGPVRDCYYRSRDAAARQGLGLRVKLRLGAVPNLNEVPWEFLYDRSTNQFLALSGFTPIVRHLALPAPVAPHIVEPPLRILAVIANPSRTNFHELQGAAEWERLSKSLAVLTETGKVELELLRPATLGELQRRLRRSEYHILHFIGHGGFDPENGSGILVLEDEEGRDHLVEGERFANLLADHTSLRLAFLNCCEGAQASQTNPFTGVAQALLQKGVPAVVAMQFEVTDAAAIELAETFYEALADGCEVDTALAETRKAIYVSANEVEWATPVLYLHSYSGRLFEINGVESPVVSEAAAFIELDEPVNGATRFALTDKPVTVGRAVGNDVVLVSDEVSRWHAVFERVGPRWRIRDLASRNGTLVNGKPVSDWALRPGDEVRVGPLRLVYHAEPGAKDGDTTRAVDRPPPLEETERTVLVALARSLASDAAPEAGTDRAFAAALHLDDDEVKRQLRRLYDKFDIPPGRGRRTRLANEAAKRGAFSASDLHDRHGGDR